MWFKFRGGVPLGMGAVDALRWTRRHASIPLARKNKQPHSTHTHLLHHALHCTLCVSRHVCVCYCVASGIVALCRHVNECLKSERMMPQVPVYFLSCSMSFLSHCGNSTSFISVSLLLRKGETLPPCLPSFFWPRALRHELRRRSPRQADRPGMRVSTIPRLKLLSSSPVSGVCEGQYLVYIRKCSFEAPAIFSALEDE